MQETQHSEEPLMRDVSDTALWAAVFRARETERQDALFRDPYAKRLAGPRGEQITDTLAHAGENSWAWVMRTYIFDEIITDQLRQGTDLVINLAAGLDARPYRMPVPNALRWVEVDLPHLVAYKQELLVGEKPVCSLERVNLDLSDRNQRRELFARLGKQAKRALVLSEGFLTYLTREENAELAEDLAAQPSLAHWLFDLISPALLAFMQQTSGQHTEKAGAPLKFAPAEGPEFFEPHGWRAEQIRSLFQAAIQTNRVPPELQQFVGFPEPPKPWSLPLPWSGVCLMRRTS
jgi:methyltransferase (TIGR00027 family)